MAKFKGDVPDDLVCGTCYRFLQLGENVSQVSKWLSAELQKEVSRERVYPLIRRGIELGFVRLSMPYENTLEENLRHLFPNAGEVRVLNVVYGPDDVNPQDADTPPPINVLASAAAEKALSLIKLLGKTEKRVGIAFGAGRTGEAFARNLSFLLRAENPEEIPPLSLHAMSPGFSIVDPFTTPVTFFSYFRTLNLDIRCMAIFCPPIVSIDHYEKTRLEIGVREVFASKKDIHIVATSLESSKEEKGQFYRLLEKADETKETMDLLNDAGWVGDVQWRPYSNSGPIELDSGSKAISLFELEELVAFAKTPGRHVILTSGPSASGNTKADALRPLLSEENLRICNHLITDIPTATELCAVESD